MTIELNTSNLIFIVAALLTAFWGLLKLIAVQHERSLDKRFTELAATIKDNQDLALATEKDLISLQGDIPRNYLRRDDYLREMHSMSEATQRQINPILASLTRIEDYLLKQKS